MPVPPRRPPRTGALPVEPPSRIAAHLLTAEGRPSRDRRGTCNRAGDRAPPGRDRHRQRRGRRRTAAVSLHPGVTLVIADLTATVFCDSSGLRQLLLAHRRAKACHAEVRFAIPHREVLAVLEVTEVDCLLYVCPSLGAAMSARPAPDGQNRQASASDEPIYLAATRPPARSWPASPEVHQQVTGLLGGPRAVRVGGHAEDVHVPGRHLHGEQHVPAFQEDRVHLEEIAGQQPVGLGAHERPPGRVYVRRGWPAPASAQDPLHGRCADPVTEPA